MFRAMAGDQYTDWGSTEYLLALAVDALHWLVWSKTEAAAKRGKPPKPIPRPGVDSSIESTDGAKSFKHDPVTLEQIMEMF